MDDVATHRQNIGAMEAARKLLIDTLARRSNLDLKNLSLPAYASAGPVAEAWLIVGKCSR